MADNRESTGFNCGGAVKTSTVWMVVVAGIFGVLVMLSIAGRETPQDVERKEAYMVSRKAECAHAMMSSIGHSTVGYADKIAYERVVHEKCEGFELGGKAL